LETIAIRSQATYLLDAPSHLSAEPLLILTLHGYGSSPEAMLRLSRMAIGDQHIVASLRGPSQYYLSGSPATNEVGYNWGTRLYPEENIRTHHEILRTVAAQLREKFSVPASRTVLMGFSQPVGLNYRFIGTHPDQAGGIIAVCGGVPKDWEDNKYHEVTAPILHISRSEDEFFPSKAAPLVRSWMARVFPSR
jgi:predicted esterase